MKSKDRECIYAVLNRHGLLDRVMGGEDDSRRRLYANRLILDSNRLSFEPRQHEDYVSLKSLAERRFAVSHHWAYCLNEDLQGSGVGWEDARAKDLGRCFTLHFPDIEEGLPLHVLENEQFRSAITGDKAYDYVREQIRGDWIDLAIYDGPPDWSEVLFIKLSELDLHQKFFGAYWDWKDNERVNEARRLRQEAFEFVRTRSQPRVQDNRVLGKWLMPVVDLWPRVRDILGLRGIQAVEFTEKNLVRLGVTIYLEDGDSGLWSAIAGKQARAHLADMGTSNYAQAFFNGEDHSIDGLDDARLIAEDFDVILAEARRIANGPAVSASPGDVASSTRAPAYLDPSHRNYSPKLAAAVAAWQAVSEEPGLANGKTVKGAITDWLTKNAQQLGFAKGDGTLNKQGIDEVAKVANWNVEGGAPGTPRRN